MVSNDGTPRRASGGTLRELFRSPHIRLRYDRRRDFVVITRFEVHYNSVIELNETFAKMELAIANVARPRTALLIDSRLAPLRNDPVFEAAFDANRRKMIRGFKKIGVLVKTAVGRLQIQRHSKIDGIPMGVFTDISEALAYLELPTSIEID